MRERKEEWHRIGGEAGRILEDMEEGKMQPEYTVWKFI